MKFSLFKALFFIIVCITPMLHSMSPAGPNTGSFGNMPELSPEDLQMINEIMNSLTPEEINELAKIGEEIIKEAEAQGIDPWDYAVMIDNQNQDYPKPNIVTPPVIPQEEPSKIDPNVNFNEKTIKNIQKQLQDLIKTLNAIIEDLLENRLLKKKFDQYCKYTVDDFIFYLQHLSKEAVLKALLPETAKGSVENKTKNELTFPPVDSNDLSAPSGAGTETTPSPHIKQKFDDFMSSMSTFYLQLSALEKELEIAEFNIYGESHACTLNDTSKAASTYSKKCKNEQIVDQIITLIQTHKDLVGTVKEFIQLYEPEALKLKTERERLEAEARAAQTAALTKWVPSYDYPSYWPDYNPSHTGSHESFGNNYPPYRPSNDNSPFRPSGNHGGPSGSHSSPSPSAPNPSRPSEPGKKPAEGTKPDTDTKGKDTKAPDKDKNSKDPNAGKPAPKPVSTADIDAKLKAHEVTSKCVEIELIARDGASLITTFPQYLTEDYDTDDFDIIKRQYILESLGKAFYNISHIITKEMNSKEFKTNATMRDLYTKYVEEGIKQFEASKEFKDLIDAKLVKAIIIDTTATPIERKVEIAPTRTVNINEDKLFIYFGDKSSLTRGTAPAVRAGLISDIKSRNVDRFVDPRTKAPTNFYELFRNGYEEYKKAITKLLAKP